MARPLLATIDLAALAHNLAVVRRHAPAARVLAVVKANAYGHGLARATRALAGADGFGLIELDAAVRLREAGYAQRILLLEGAFEPSELPVLAHHRIATVVHCRDQVDMLKDLPGNAALDVFVKVNTGMNRLGFEPGAIPGVVAELRRLPPVGNLTLMTHFASADEARGVGWQMEILEQAQQAPRRPPTSISSR
jgi:alanine racemase